MPYHPSLEEVLEKENSFEDEWAEFCVKEIAWSIWVTAEEVVGEKPDPEYGFKCGVLSSEYGTFYREKIILNFEISSEDNIKKLKGSSKPLGAFSYYSENEAMVKICITQKTYDDIVKLMLAGKGELSVRISIPKWEDKECKCVPITQYQMIFNAKQE